ncbi:MAG: gamma carbonic anhydrase family protein [Cuniculiplasma sp.]
MENYCVGNESYVSDLCSLRGNVKIGSNCSIFDFASLRADMGKIVVGDFSNVQDNVSIHSDPGFDTVIGKYVSIGHNAVVHGCTIEDECLIGMGAIVMNGAKIGRGTVIASGAVILENTIISENSMVAGVPGKVRSASTKYREMAHTNAEEYVSLKNHYLNGEFRNFVKDMDGKGL